MQTTASLVATWLLQRRRAVAARVIAARGLGPRAAAEVVLVDDDGHIGGTLLGGVVHRDVAAAAARLLADGSPHAMLAVTVDAADATACGLTCGGEVEILLQRLDVIPAELWETLAAGRPAAIVTALGTSSSPMVVLPGGATFGTLNDSALEAIAEGEAEPLLTFPGTSATRIPVGDVELVIEAWNPVPRLVVVGMSDLSVALTRQVELLGWTSTTVVGADNAAGAIAALTPADVVVVLDHDPFVATPALEAALRRGIGYIGALGSRSTQEQRRALLADRGVRPIDVMRVRGPTGLDLGARTPAEAAVSIIAEILAVRSGRSGTPLSLTTTRITG